MHSNFSESMRILRNYTKKIFHFYTIKLTKVGEDSTWFALNKLTMHHKSSWIFLKFKNACEENKIKN